MGRNKKKTGCGCATLIILALIAGSCSLLFGSGGNKKKTDTSKTTTPVVESTTQATTEATTEATKATTEATTEEQASIGQRNALSKAISYLDYTAFSKEGLRKQLEYEGFEADDIEYAIENCDADWKEQAVKKAHEYLNYTSFSKDGLIDQLKYEGFTDEEAEYGADQAYQ